jgi:hypothetical protein
MDNKEFVPYEQALALKELGFNKIFCYGFYFGTEDVINVVTNMQHKTKNKCLAPTFSQAFRWFRDNYGILHDIDFGIGWGYGFIPVGTEIDLPTTFTEGFNSYEEAELACLKKLIEIVKNK